MLRKISIFTVVTLVSIVHIKQTSSSGVFELEFLDIRQLNSPNKVSDLRTNNSQVELPTNNSNNSATETQEKLFKVHVCLKEAHTNQLNEPCTFGGATITLSRNSFQTSMDQSNSTIPEITTQAGIISTSENYSNESTRIGQQQDRDRIESRLTNKVRILFTFRWTKSFTIILNTEHIEAKNANTTLEITGQNQRSVSLVGANYHYLAKFPNGTNANSSEPTPDLSQSMMNRTRLAVDRSVKSADKSMISTDRHVFYESEVLPNSMLDNLWTDRLSRTPRSSVIFRFRVYCSANHYGDDCARFCRARDDQFGHYNCSSSGRKVCLAGWEGAECNTAICRAGCNLRHGRCDKPDTCQCQPGWTGPRCDECLTYPGCQKGYCLGAWGCICHHNWGGVLCDQDLNYCSTHEPCKNNGTCHNVAPGRYKCECPDGFTGVNCDLNLSQLPPTETMSQLNAGCALNPCLNGGTCYGFRSTSLDQVDVNDSFEASELDDRVYRCQCPTGWTGDYCQWHDLSSLHASNLLIVNVTERPSSPSSKLANLTESMTQLASMEGYTTFVEPTIKSSPAHANLSLKHLISGVVVASAIGVFLASLLLAWCCLIAIERKKFSFIQMNIISSQDVGHDSDEGRMQAGVSSALRRMHAKLRNSFRSRSTIKPDTKLSIENVLRAPKLPPPSYEESSNLYVNSIAIEYPSKNFPPANNNMYPMPNGELIVKNTIPRESTNLVINNTIESHDNLIPKRSSHKQSLNTVHTAYQSQDPDLIISERKLSCPRHGPLYRHHQQLKSNVHAKLEPGGSSTSNCTRT